MKVKSYRYSRHLIVDIETLGTVAPAPILSIGMVFLDFNSANPTFVTDNIHVDPAVCVGEADEKTQEWWKNQSEQARTDAFLAVKDTDPFGRFVAKVNEFKPDFFWSKGPDFDFGHLAAQLTPKRYPLPWRYWQLRDIRSLVGLFSAEAEEEDEACAERYGLVPHVALNDAIAEARFLTKCVFVGNCSQALIKVGASNL